MKLEKRTVLREAGLLLGTVLMFVLMFAMWLIIGEYKPAPIEEIAVSGEAERTLSTGETVRVLTYNTGYSDLGKESDFFMDGGKKVRNNNLEGMMKNFEGNMNIAKNAGADLIFFQEVDTCSKRTHRINQVEIIAERFGGESVFGYNFLCDYVPFPLPTIGKVGSGIMTVSASEISSGERYSLPCPFKWPISAANLKRCMTITRIPLADAENELVAINFHLEAYDDGEGKIAQTNLLWETIVSEYEKGNYVIAGGDFNQTFPGIEVNNTGDVWAPGVLDANIPEGWRYVFDDSTPTCRSLHIPLTEFDGSEPYCVIDGFIISPNVELVSVKTIDEHFEYSDHNPVLMEVVLK